MMFSGRKNCRLRPWVAAIAGAIIWQTPVTAGSSISPPTFAACNPTTPPELPIRWRAVGIMMPPFLQGQIDIGEFIYDGALPAMSATVYGLESGAVSLLVTETDTFVLSGPHRSPTHCTSLGPRLRPPSPQWLSSQAVCVGESTLATQPVQWWQRRGFEPAWYWFSTRTRLPWRSLFLNRSLDPTIIGDYAMTYFSTFTPLPETNLSALRDLCTATAERTGAEAVAGLPTARELMAIRNEDAEAERVDRIGELIPGLSHTACSRMTPVHWPEQFVTTAIITPANFDQGPYPSLIYYDWSQAETQLVLPFHGNPPVLQGIISLKKRVGYRIMLPPIGGAGICEPVLPGMIRPDWGTVARCECKGVIDRNSALSPLGETEILSCPLNPQEQRVSWHWYTSKKRPIMFMEAAPQAAGGFMLADYVDWLPGQTGRKADFELAKTCNAPNKSGHSPTETRAPTVFDVSCSGCHTTR